jgi:hypothetical protein
MALRNPLEMPRGGGDIPAMKWAVFFLVGLAAVLRGGPLKFEPAEVNFGTQGQGVHLEAEVKLTNTTTQTIHLLNVTSDCSCTAGEPRLRRLGPGESTIMPVGFDTRSYQGVLVRHLVVNTSAGSAELRVKANLRAFAQWEVTPMPVMLPTSQRRQEISAKVVVKHDGPGRFAVQDATTDQPWLQATLGAATAGQPQAVELRKLASAPVGAHLVQLTLRTNDPQQPVLPIKVVVSVVSPVRVSPNPIVLPAVPVGGTTTREVLVSGWEETSVPRAKLTGGRVESLGPRAGGDHAFSVAVTPASAGIHNLHLQFAVDEDNVLITVPVILKAEAKP